MPWYGWIINAFAFYCMIGCIMTLIAVRKSGKDDLHDKEVTTAFLIIFTWGWKYRKMAKKLKDLYRWP